MTNARNTTGNITEPRFDIEGRLKIYFPIFFELLGNNKLDWKTITKVFTKKVEQWIMKYESTGQHIRVEASLYNVITASIQGNAHAISHLDFIRKLFEDLILRLDATEQKLVVPALYGLLTNMNKAYRNFLGELCVLNNVKRNTNLKLVNVEVPVVASRPDGPKLDFKFFNSEKSTHLLVEIVNVHLNDVAEWSDEKLSQLLQEKIQHKLNITGISENETFHLIPVFWGSFEELKRTNKFYKENGPQFKNTVEPVSFASFTKLDGSKIHVFGTISSIVDMHNKSLEC
jgi:hypothetical protein